MAYNYFPNTYQAIPQYPTQPNVYPTPMGVGNNQPNTQSSMIWVQGESGAKSYMVAPNQTVVLWDSESQVIYLKSANASGLPSMQILDYTIRDNTPQTPNIQPQADFATKDDVLALQKEINAIKSKFSDRQSDRKPRNKQEDK